MNLTSITLSIVLVGLPAFAGGYLLIRYVGHKKASNGLPMLIFAIAVGSTLVLFQPEGRISHGNYLLTAPGALVVSIVMGAIFGFLSRRRAKNPKQGQ